MLGGTEHRDLSADPADVGPTLVTPPSLAHSPCCFAPAPGGRLPRKTTCVQVLITGSQASPDVSVRLHRLELVKTTSVRRPEDSVSYTSRHKRPRPTRQSCGPLSRRTSAPASPSLGPFALPRSGDTGIPWFLHVAHAQTQGSATGFAGLGALSGVRGQKTNAPNGHPGLTLTDRLPRHGRWQPPHGSR